MKGEIGTAAICEMCGNEYTVTGRGQKYCPSCGSIRRRETIADGMRRKAAGASRKIGSTAICERCGAEYTTTGGNQKFCQACARSHWNGGEFRRIGSTVTCKRCGGSFTLTVPSQRYCPACASIKSIARVEDSFHDPDAFPALLKKYGITQAEFSHRFCVGASLVSRWYTGERKCPSYVLYMAEELLTIDAKQRKNEKEEPT